eukprot:3152259-Amphidinium_carterae.1
MDKFSGRLLRQSHGPRRNQCVVKEAQPPTSEKKVGLVGAPPHDGVTVSVASLQPYSAVKNTVPVTKGQEHRVQSSMVVAATVTE